MDASTTSRRGEDGLLPQGGKSIFRSIPGWHSWHLHVAWARFLGASWQLHKRWPSCCSQSPSPEATVQEAAMPRRWAVLSEGISSDPKAKRDRTDPEPGVAAFPQLECVWHSSVWRQLLGAVQSRENGRAAPSLWHYLPCCPWFQAAYPYTISLLSIIFSSFRTHHLLYRNMKQQMIVWDTIVHSIVLLCPTLLIA